MIGWSVTAVLLAVLLAMKVGIRIHWEKGEAVLRLRVGPFRFSLSTADAPKKEEKPQKTAKQTKTTKPKSGRKWLRAVLAYWRELLELVGRVLRMPQLDLLRLHITAGGADAESCAMNYGRICAGLSSSLPLVYGAFRLKKEDIQVTCDFERPKTEVVAEAEATVRVYEIVVFLLCALVLLLKLYNYTKNNEKAVQSL